MRGRGRVELVVRASAAAHTRSTASTWSRYGRVSPARARGLGLERDELGVEPGRAGPARRPRRRAGRAGRPRRRAGARASEAAPCRPVAFRSAGPEVAVDQPRDVLVEPEREQDVVARDRVGRGHRAACRRPPGRRSRHRCIFSGRGARGASWSRCASAWRRASASRSARAGSDGRPDRSGARSGRGPWRRADRPARPRPSRRRTASPGARRHRGSSAARPSSARRPPGRRRPPRRRSSVGRGRSPFGLPTISQARW